MIGDKLVVSCSSATVVMRPAEIGDRDRADQRRQRQHADADVDTLVYANAGGDEHRNDLRSRIEEREPRLIGKRRACAVDHAERKVEPEPERDAIAQHAAERNRHVGAEHEAVGRVDRSMRAVEVQPIAGVHVAERQPPVRRSDEPGRIRVGRVVSLGVRHAGAGHAGRARAHAEHLRLGRRGVAATSTRPRRNGEGRIAARDERAGAVDVVRAIKTAASNRAAVSPARR